MIKRKIDKVLAEGHGKQLVWLFVFTLVCIVCAIVIARFVFNDDTLSWQYVVGLILDPGVFGSFPDKGHDLFRLVLALISVFLFSALLVSVFTNVFENISTSVRDGKRRYPLKNHILIIGGGHHLGDLLQQYQNTQKSIVVMSDKKPLVEGNYIYYKGKRDDKTQLKSACISTADSIYIIGEDNEVAHDAYNLKCLDYVKELSLKSKKGIHCFITLHEQVSTEVFQYLTNVETGNLLLVDVINDYEFIAEQLLVNTDFLPVIKMGEDKMSHLIIIGSGAVAQAVAYTAAHLSHYPTKKKTKITVIDEGIHKWMDELVASRPGLFELTHYQYVSADGTVKEYVPDPKLGDFLDVEWEFLDSYDSSSFTREYLAKALLNKQALVTLYVCYENAIQATSSVLHLPRIVYENAFNIAVFLNTSTELIERAVQTGMYGKISIFGNTPKDSGVSMMKRSTFGKRVNFVYDQKYSEHKSKDEEEAWYKIPEAHKYSSIYCASAMFLLKKCFDLKGERRPIYEAEHRRWMMSVLLMGYRKGKVRDKSHFIHNDIIPFEDLPLGEQDKDKDIIDAMDYILKDSTD